VSDDAAKIPSPFDVSTIKNLVSLMSRHDLSEIDLREGELRIRLRRGPKGITVQSLPTQLSAPNSTPLPAAPPAAAPGPAAEAPKQTKPLLEIKSPTPGTFYVAPSPDAQPFVRVGSKVTPSSVVCIIEAMKIFNEITADCTGVIVEVNVENQQPVEFGQVLFKVDPAG
jgi:acetyl-CoA carboxylase biotin carboxyl carrier protein